MIKIKCGLDLPIEGKPEQQIQTAAAARSVAVIGFDFEGMKPTMAVKEGDHVKLGTLLFTDKKNPGVNFTSPGAGRVATINRGEKRALQSVVIDLEGDEQEIFPSYSVDQLASLDPQQVRQQLIDSGVWTAFKTRPFSHVPSIDATANAIFVTAIDTNPLAADPAVVIAEHSESFNHGLSLLTQLGANKVYCCTAVNAAITISNKQIIQEEFAGPHPAGLAGTHIHMLDPVSVNKTAWSINYQDVIAIGKLFTEGKIFTERVVSIAGPSVLNPGLYRTRLGASTDELTAGQLEAGDTRIISGSVFNGRKARGPYAYLGRYHQQITVLKEGREREFMSYARAGVNKHSILSTFISSLTPKKLFAFDTSTNGSDRAMVPVGSFERVMPLDILPTQLLRSLVVGDTAVAQQLGCLELDEEDLALCTYACSGKYEYGPILRNNLTRIEKEG